MFLSPHHSTQTPSSPVQPAPPPSRLLSRSHRPHSVPALPGSLKDLDRCQSCLLFTALRWLPLPKGVCLDHFRGGTRLSKPSLYHFLPLSAQQSPSTMTRRHNFRAQRRCFFSLCLCGGASPAWRDAPQSVPPPSFPVRRRLGSGAAPWKPSPLPPRSGTCPPYTPASTKLCACHVSVMLFMLPPGPP